jgi:hypothetical protein
VTKGRGPAAPGGTPGRSGQDLRRRKRPGESGEKITDIGAICRTEGILDALAARWPPPRSDPALAALAALAADVDEHGGQPGPKETWREDTFVRQVRRACGENRVTRARGSAAVRIVLASCRLGLRNTVAVAAAFAVLFICIATAAAMHGRLSWLVTTSSQAAATRQRMSGAPGDAAGRTQTAGASNPGAGEPGSSWPVGASGPVDSSGPGASEPSASERGASRGSGASEPSASSGPGASEPSASERGASDRVGGSGSGSGGSGITAHVAAEPVRGHRDQRSDPAERRGDGAGRTSAGIRPRGLGAVDGRRFRSGAGRPRRCWHPRSRIAWSGLAPAGHAHPGVAGSGMAGSCRGWRCRRHPLRWGSSWARPCHGRWRSDDE